MQSKPLVKLALQLALAVCLLVPGVAGQKLSALGTWEGESICTVRPSPCHDEQVVYEIRPSKTKGVTIDMYKVVEGKRELMGPLECPIATPTQLICSAQKGRIDSWEFEMSGDEMTGKLFIDKERTLYRRIKVKKVTSRK